MNKKIVVYKNTGFNSVNIPAEPSVLVAAAGNNKQEYADVYFLREDIDLPVVRINDSYQNLKYVDYVEIKNSDGTERMFYFAIPRSMAKNTTAIYLQLDALTTMGGAKNLTYTSGWQSRGHVSAAEDVLFNNIADEDFMPSQEMKVYNYGQLDGGSNNSDLNIVTTSVNLGDFYGSGDLAGFGDWANKVFEGKINAADADAVMYWPAIRSCRRITTYYCDGDSYFVPSNGSYDYNSSGGEVRDALNKLFSMGQLQLQSSYKLPGKWYSNAQKFSGDNGAYSGLTGYTGVQLTGIPFLQNVSGYTIKNKKTHAMFRKIVLQSVATGDMQIKSPSEVYESGQSVVRVKLWADPSPSGKPYARFNYINSSPFKYDSCVKGAQWVSNQLALEGASGGVWNSINAGMQNGALVRQFDQYNENYLAQSTKLGRQQQYAADAMPWQNKAAQLGIAGQALGVGIGAAGGSVGSILNIPGNMIGTYQSAINYGLSVAQKLNVDMPNMQTEQDIMAASQAFNRQSIQQAVNENAVGMLRSNKLVSPTIMFSPDAGLALYGYNYFIAYEISMQGDDIVALDKYFQRFGYNGLHRPLDASCFAKRSHYNFVQAFDVAIDSAYPMRVRQAGIAQLNAGVRVWLERPNVAAYDIN